MSATPDAAMRARREAKIQEHIAAENRRDSAATLATMHEAHYDVVPWGLVVDGRDNVRDFLEGYFTMMPAIHTEPTRFYHADDALIVETRTVGTHEGEIEGIPANGRPFEVNAIGIFTFDGDNLLGEKVVSDMLSLLRQISEPSTEGISI
jgi:steroid delta-isomerase-like uncharacterized protein